MSAMTDWTKLVNDLDPLALVRGPRPGAAPDWKLLFLGAGVIGGSVGAWVAEHYRHVRFLDQGAVADAIRRDGITTYPGDHPDERRTVRVDVVDSIADAADADVVVLGVKNFSLEPVAKAVKKVMGDRPIIVAMQNGVENQKILPRHFSRVVYAVISYNAWADEPGVIGYQKKGPLHLGTARNELQTELEDLARIFNMGVETHVTHHIADAAHCKLVINLTNSLTTLIGMGYREIEDRPLFQKLLTNLTWEGVQIVRAAGVRESKLGGMPSWSKLWAGANLPRPITKGLFERNVAKMVLSSMAQDVLQRKSRQTELDSINGYLLELADRHGVAAPYNRAVYRLARDEFAKPEFQPLSLAQVWSAVEREMGSSGAGSGK